MRCYLQDYYPVEWALCERDSRYLELFSDDYSLKREKDDSHDVKLEKGEDGGAESAKKMKMEDA